MDEWIDGWMDRWMDGCMDGWMDGWINIYMRTYKILCMDRIVSDDYVCVHDRTVTMYVCTIGL